MAGFTWSLWVVPTAYVLYKVLTFGRREKNLPPGPPTIPVLGNAHLIPLKGLHLKFKEWADQYGSVYSLKIGRTTMIVLSDREAVFELLSRRGAHYNSRPVDKQIDAALGEENLSLMYEGPVWRAQRKIVSTYLSPKNLDTVLQPIQVAEVSQLMYDLLTKPEGFYDSVKRTTASLSTITLFGHRALALTDYWGSAVYRSIDEVNKAIAPGSYLPVDHIPLLKLLPDRWNAPFQVAKQSYQDISSIWAEARERVEKRRRDGDVRESLMDRVLDEKIVPDASLSCSQMNNFFGTMNMGASDTTSGHTLASILFLAEHPEFQDKARKELDEVCGTERMPEWSDFQKLPYINCIIKESLRMRAS
jgi:cytochrome P450